ncbi:MAG TPA: dual specificity protein phosphatase family protein [Solirubrobacteraceae bacterium]|jgi:protein-tyrosine phosphatase|nr:dual specificity protein phosphatase family protein [Solirubrobacteraceae bacterium]
MSRWFRSYGFAEVADRLLVGAYPLDDEDVAMLARLHVSRVLNLVEDAEYPEGAREAVSHALAAAGIAEQRQPMPDYGGLPASRIDTVVDQALEWLDAGKTVYLHCRAGWQRSAALAAAILTDRDGRALDQAMAQVQTRKPSADPLPHQRDDLERWWKARSD